MEDKPLTEKSQSYKYDDLVKKFGEKITTKLLKYGEATTQDGDVVKCEINITVLK